MEILVLIFTYLHNVLSILGFTFLLVIFAWHIIKYLYKNYNNKNIDNINNNNNNNEFNTSGKAILITGCDSGFGNRLAFRLNQIGFMVYATVLDVSNKGSKQLISVSKNPDKMKVIKMDVTSDKEVKDVYDEVCEDLNTRGYQLWALVNNAGTLTMGNFDWGTIDRYKRTFEVNTLGTVRTTRTFISLLRKSKGRIVNMACISGRYTVQEGVDFCMSYSAVISFSDALRRDLHKSGIKVSTIEPGGFKTNMGNVENLSKGIYKLWNETPKDIQSYYGVDGAAKVKNWLNRSSYLLHDNIDIVVDDMIDAIRSSSPKIRYTPGGRLWFNIFAKLNDYLPTEIMDRVSYAASK